MNSYYAKPPKQIVLEEKKIMCMVEHIYLTSSLFAKVSFSCMFEKFGGGGKLCTFKTSKVQEILENKMQNVGACAIRLITVPICIFDPSQRFEKKLARIVILAVTMAQK